MAIFGAGLLYDPRTGRGLAGATASVRHPETGDPVSVSNPVVTNVKGYYPRFETTGPDAELRHVTLTVEDAVQDVVAVGMVLSDVNGLVALTGSVATSSALPGTGDTGDAYVVVDTGHLWLWDGSAWVDAGQIRGADGSDATVTDPAVAAAIGSQTTAGIGIVVRDRTRTWDVTAHGVPVDGTTLADTALNALLAQMAPGDTLFVPPGATVRLGAGRTIAKPLVIDCPGTVTTTANVTLFTFGPAASGSRVRRMTATGPGGSGASVLLALAGTPGGTWVTDVIIDDVRATSFYGAIRGSHARNVTTRNVTTVTGHYYGQMYLSCEYVNVYNPVTHGLTGLASNGNSYPVTFTRDTTQSAATHPNSAHGRVYGGESRNTTWEAIDTHGGIDIKVYDHTSVGTHTGIAFVHGADGSPPVDCWAYGCDVDSGRSDGTAGVGLTLTGTGAARNQLASGGFVGCTARGYGTQNSLLSGAVRLVYTENVLLSGLRLIEPSPLGIFLETGNQGVNINGVTVVDPWTNDAAFAAGGRISSNDNTVTVANMHLRRGSKTATRVAENGWRTANSLTGVEVRVGPGNDFAAATVGQWQLMAPYMRETFYGASPVAKPVVPAAGTVTAADLRNALAALGLI